MRFLAETEHFAPLYILSSRSMGITQSPTGIQQPTLLIDVIYSKIFIVSFILETILSFQLPVSVSIN